MIENSQEQNYQTIIWGVIPKEDKEKIIKAGDHFDHLHYHFKLSASKSEHSRNFISTLLILFGLGLVGIESAALLAITLFVIGLAMKRQLYMEYRQEAIKDYYSHFKPLEGKRLIQLSNQIRKKRKWIYLAWIA